MYTIGIDLAITAAHKAIVAGADGKFVTPLLSFHTRWRDIQQLVARIREDAPMRAVMEPTGMAWFPVSIALHSLGVRPYLVSGQRTYDLRRYFKRHASSDRVSARVLAKMPFVDEESLYPLEIPSSLQFACQRACKELDRVQTDIAAIKNRLRDTGRFSWPEPQRRERWATTLDKPANKVKKPRYNERRRRCRLQRVVRSVCPKPDTNPGDGQQGSGGLTAKNLDN